MAIDGLVLDVPATPDNDKEFGRSGNATAPSPFPQVRLVAVGECGTHGIVDAAFGPVGTGEQTLAAQLIARFTPDMLVLADRNFYSYQAWQQAVATGAALLWRVSASLTLPVLEWLPDGSFRSVLINPTVRGRRREQLLAAAAAGGGAGPRPGHAGPGRRVHDRQPGRWWGAVGSDRGALPGSLPVGFPGPPAAPGVRLSPHRALHVSCQWVSRWRRLPGSVSMGSGSCCRGSGSG